ncbi:MAG: nitric oxide dioxygenase [Myxococcota bacterium]|nr:nitric oxide dioxygenase [Myxococcota bacterium]
MLSDTEKTAIRQSWRLVVPIADTAADLFYRRLFELRPEYRELFGIDMASQKRKLLHMLAFTVKSVDFKDSDWRDDVSPDQDLMLVILALGRRHSELYRIPNDSYAVVAEALLWTLKFGLGDAFTPEVEAAWTKIYTLLSRTMQMASATLNREAPMPTVAETQAVGENALRQQKEAMGVDEESLMPQEHLS